MILNEYQEAKCRIRIPGQAVQVLSVIERLTFGWNKKEATISLRTFRKMTGIDDSNILRSRDKLLKMGLIINSNPTRGEATSENASKKLVNYRIQMDYTKWKPLAKTLVRENASKSTSENASKPLARTQVKSGGLLNTPYKDISINTAKTKKEKNKSGYEKAREVKIKTLHKKYEPEFEKAKKTKNSDWLDSINNKIKEELAKFSHKYHLRKRRKK